MSKFVLITGATGVVGRAFATGLAAQGFSLILTSRSRDEDLIAECESYDVTCHYIPLDMLAENSISQLADQLSDIGVSVYAAINNARSLDFLKTGEDGLVSDEAWVGEFSLDVVRPYQMSMMLQQFSVQRIINISSIYGLRAPKMFIYDDAKNSPINYGVCKAAQIHLTKELAVRLAPSVLVNAVSYGGIGGRAPQDFVERYSSMSPNKRMLETRELLAPIMYLLDESNTGATGENLVVDGGWTAW